MPLFYVQQVGPNLVMLSPVGATDPGFGQGGGERPDQGLPWAPGHPDQGLPGRPPHVGNRPPGSGGGGIPDNELPDTPPPQVLPGHTLVMIRHEGKWAYAAIAPGSPPPRPLPPIGGGGHPDQGLPPAQGRPDQGLPGDRPPHASGQPVPPPPSGNRPDQGLPPTPQPRR